MMILTLHSKRINNMCATSYKPELLREAFYRGALALEELFLSPFTISEKEFWESAIIQERFELFVNGLNKEEQDEG